MYYFLFGLLYLVSLLPLRVLYLLSDFIYFIVYKVFGYRKKVVLQNLSIAFPHKTQAEKEAIARKFYRNFTDNFIETIKFISASQSYIKRHCDGDFSLVHEVYKQGRSIQVLAGHNFNWELVNLAVAPSMPGKVLAVYLPLNNAAFERLFRYIRMRFGTMLIAAKRMKEDMLPHRGTQYIIGLVADQSPGVPHRAHWVQFFGRPTGFLKGPENAARRNNYPVFFIYFTKRKRGFYTAHVELLTDNAHGLPEGQLTKMYVNYLEQVMTEHPELWLWSHRRWKHEWKPDYDKVIE
ncbi:MAG TPA: lysophospholipid acyltransferase family protein [Flavisolibacter sp.]|nr:lysophospholipid acyltransferase family protein [Flavisolibacter sp.]